MRNIGRGGGAATVVLVGLDNEAMGMVRETLAAEAVLPSQSIGFGDALEVLEKSRPDVVIVGYTKAIDAALALAEEVKRESPNVVMIALAATSDASAILGAMRSGYKEFVVLPADAARLRTVVHEAAYSSDDDEEKGRVISLTGAKGGVGTTTLAIHLAAELAGIHRVLVIDCDFGMGDLAPMMDLTARDSIADVIERADRLDERMLNSSVAVHRTKVNVLPTPDDVDQLGPPRADDIYAIINVASKAFQWVIIDCGAYYDEAVAMSLSVSDSVVLITTPDVTSVRDTFRRLRSLAQLGVDKKRVRLVVNRWHKGAYVGLKQINENLGVPVAATIADDAAHVERAVNEGKLVREVNKRCDSARDISGLVAMLTEDPEDYEASAEESGSSGGWLSGWFGRG